MFIVIIFVVMSYVGTSSPGEYCVSVKINDRGPLVWTDLLTFIYVTGSAKTSLFTQDRKFDFFHTNTKLNECTIKFHFHSRPE